MGGINRTIISMKEQLSEEYTNHVPVAYTCTGGYRDLFVSFKNIFVESAQVLCLVKSGDVTLPAAAIQGMESQIKFDFFLKTMARLPTSRVILFHCCCKVPDQKHPMLGEVLALLMLLLVSVVTFQVVLRLGGVVGDVRAFSLGKRLTMSPERISPRTIQRIVDGSIVE